VLSDTLTLPAQPNCRQASKDSNSAKRLFQQENSLEGDRKLGAFSATSRATHERHTVSAVNTAVSNRRYSRNDQAQLKSGLNRSDRS
jgi:hypothetical protein